MNAKQIAAALQARHTLDNNWLFFHELKPATGFARGAEQTIDAWAMATIPSMRFERISYEIKVSRADFLRELRQPAKRRMALLISNEFYFVTPPGIVKVEELPPECGLIEVAPVDQMPRYGTTIRGGGAFISFTMVCQAPWRDTPPPSWGLLAALTRRALKKGNPPIVAEALSALSLLVEEGLEP